MADRWHVGQSLIHNRLHGDEPAPALGTINGDYGGGAGIVQAGGDGLMTKAGKQRHRHGPNPGGGEKCGDDFGHHGHIDANLVVRPQP